MKKKLFLISFIMVLLFPQITSAKSFSYWYSDTNRIGKVNNHYLTYINYSGGHSAVDFGKYMRHARNQWSSAGVNTYEGATQANATINWFGGTVKKLTELEPSLRYYAAVTVMNHSHVRNDTYNGKAISNRKITKAKIYTPKKSLYSAKKYRTMFTHELGHALGYLGHSTSKNDLMHSSGIKDVLTTRDKRHVSQNC